MITLVSPKKSINPVFFKQPVPQKKIEKLKEAFSVYLSAGKPEESEEFHKNLIKDFLANTWFTPDYSVNTNGREDLVIFNGNSTNSKPAVIIEAKSPANSAEMFSENNPNCKALQECVYYFLQEKLKLGNNEIKHIIITNYCDFYIFDAKDFSRFFLVKTNPILDQFKKFEAGQLSDTKTSYFYDNCAKPAIAKWIENENISVTHFSKDDFAKFIQKGEDERLIPLYKIFSPEHLLNKSFVNDLNSLDKNFYEELLYIIGLEETAENNKKFIRRKKENNRDSASLIESAIYQLEEQISNENERFETALRLVINWINRLIFLKLVESQQLAYQKGNPEYKFLTTDTVSNFNELNTLFFKVLGRKVEERDPEVKQKYRYVPYLNSSLFELSEEERFLQIRGIQNKPMKLFSNTVVKDDKGRKITGSMDNLAYIFKFLDSYNFSSETECGIVQNTKTLINASVLGLIFEKINGYKDGSFFTPGLITEYMAKEAVDRLVIRKFNDLKGWECKTLDELSDKIENRAEANEIINSIHICDPAVGSGHFLVSLLNRLLFIKSYLDILLDKNGRRIRRSDWEIRLENDEISILDEEGNPFIYSINSERQRVQETIFGEKRKIIENCLFGVDINPASVYICRLRLWIELLKNAFYTEESNFTQLETLPNIDINIRCGNSLVSRYSIKTGSSVLDEGNPDTRKLIRQYRDAVAAYKNESNKENKRRVDKIITDIKRQIHGVAQLSLFDEELNKKILDEDIYANSFEWMIEFPEVLDENGKFQGFDAVIGNPPYVQLQTNGGELAKIYEKRGYASFAKTGDIYCLFYELGSKLLKKNGNLCFITSNKWMRAGYGEKLRDFFAKNVNPKLLVDFAGVKVFDAATVDTNILLFENGKNEGKTQSCIATSLTKDGLANLSDFVRQNSTLSKFDGSNSWVILSPIEQSIKAKIEKIGTPLKDWDINIYRGVLTGFNDAFIISGEKREEILGNCKDENERKRTEELIRPILRGRDIKRYSYEYADLYLIATFPSKHYDIENYPAVKEYLLTFGMERLEQTGKEYKINGEKIKARKKTNNKWFETQDSISYWEDFNKPKIVWAELSRTGNSFAFDNTKMFVGNTGYILTVPNDNPGILKYLLGFLNSRIILYYLDLICTRFDDNGWRWLRQFVENIPIPEQSLSNSSKLIEIVENVDEYNQKNSSNKINEIVAEVFKLTDAEISYINKNLSKY